VTKLVTETVLVTLFYVILGVFKGFSS